MTTTNGVINNLNLRIMEIKEIKKNCLGTMSFTLRLGKMKKAEEFVTYPIQSDDDGKYIHLQSDHRWAALQTKTGKIIVSARRAQYANYMWLRMCMANGTAETDLATAEQLETIINAVRSTANPMAGGNNILSMYCDNSNANMI